MRLEITLREQTVIQPTFGEMLERLWKDKHTGPVILHLAQGVPNTIEIPSEPTRIKLEKR